MSEVQKLSQVIAAKGIALGETEVGKEFALKCLHPSDPTAACVGVPDGGCLPTFMHNYQYTYTIGAPDPTKPTWDADVVLLPHPYHMGYSLMKSESAGGDVALFVNTQCPNDVNFPKQISRYRLAYWSVTGYHDAPALANQGTVVATQYPLGRVKLNLNGLEYGADKKSKMAARSSATPVTRRIATDGQVLDFEGVQSPYGATLISTPVVAFVEDPKPFQVLQTMPNAYMGLARDGFYVPGRVQKFKWKLARDQRFVLGFQSAINTYLDADGNPIGMGIYARSGEPEIPLGVYAPKQPGDTMQGVTVMPSTEDVIHVAMRNMSKDSRWTLYIRMGFEYQAQPGSVFSPLLKSPVPADHQALRVVHAISRELKDAYPASYNDFGKLLNVISSAASGLAPMLGSFAPLASGIGIGAKLLSSVIPSRRDQSTKERGNRPPSAAVEQVHAKMQRPIVVVQERREGDGRGKKKRTRRAKKKASGQAGSSQAHALLQQLLAKKK